jgi:hypothetical protein
VSFVFQGCVAACCWSCLRAVCVCVSSLAFGAAWLAARPSIESSVVCLSGKQHAQNWARARQSKHGVCALNPDARLLLRLETTSQGCCLRSEQASWRQMGGFREGWYQPASDRRDVGHAHPHNLRGAGGGRWRGRGLLLRALTRGWGRMGRGGGGALSCRLRLHRRWLRAIVCEGGRRRC